jgi:glycolate oxidase FAD binding subunit
LRLEGFAASVAYRTERLSALLAPFGSVLAEQDASAARALWKEVRDVQAFAETSGDVWRISVKPSDAPDIAALAQGDALFDWGGGLIWVCVPEGTDLRARLGAFAGHATLVRASEDTRARIAPFQPEAAPVAALSEGLRQQFDPRGILNRGLMAA